MLQHIPAIFTLYQSKQLRLFVTGLFGTSALFIKLLRDDTAKEVTKYMIFVNTREQENRPVFLRYIFYLDWFLSCVGINANN